MCSPQRIFRRNEEKSKQTLETTDSSIEKVQSKKIEINFQRQPSNEIGLPSTCIAANDDQLDNHEEDGMEEKNCKSNDVTIHHKRQQQQQLLQNVVNCMEKKHDETQVTFPQKLMEILSDETISDIITWLPHGKAFIVIDKSRFTEEVIPKYFSKHTKYASFTRKLNRWSFSRITRGPEVGAYFHSKFQRGQLYMCLDMRCIHNPTKDRLLLLPPQKRGSTRRVLVGMSELSCGSRLYSQEMEGSAFSRFGYNSTDQEAAAKRRNSLILANEEAGLPSSAFSFKETPERLSPPWLLSSAESSPTMSPVEQSFQNDERQLQWRQEFQQQKISSYFDNRQSFSSLNDESCYLPHHDGENRRNEAQRLGSGYNPSNVSFGDQNQMQMTATRRESLEDLQSSDEVVGSMNLQSFSQIVNTEWTDPILNDENLGRNYNEEMENVELNQVVLANGRNASSSQTRQYNNKPRTLRGKQYLTMLLARNAKAMDDK